MNGSSATPALASALTVAATRHVESKLHLKVNRDKTEVSYAGKVKYLGYSFYMVKDKCRLRLHPKSVTKMRSKLKVLTSYSIVCKGGIIHYKTFGSAWSVLCFVVLHLKTTLCLFTLPLFPGAFLFRPTFLNLFDLPVFFEVAGVYGDKEATY